MHYQGIEKFSSKRNQVLLAKSSTEGNKLVVVKNFGGNIDAFATELNVVTALQKRGVLTPKILKTMDRELVYQYIDGDIVLNFVDKLEQDWENTAIYQVFDKLCLWLTQCYNALEEEFGKEMILSDIHLRNFIFKDKIFGVDFECVTEGRKEQDIARLAVFTATYYPEFTNEKYALAGYICHKCLEYMHLDNQLLLNEIECQLAIIARRRNAEYSSVVVEQIKNNIDALDKKNSYLCNF